MDLVSQIVNELVDSKAPLANPLLKTKVLAKRLNNTTLLNWVDDELNGYTSEVPPYRRFTGNVIGTMHNGFQQFNNTSVPLMFLKEDFRNGLLKFEFTHGISALEALRSDDKGATLEIAIPPELCAVITRDLKKKGHNINVIVASKQISANVVSEILGSVRTKLLGLMLELEGEDALKADIVPNRTINDKITTIMSQTIINNTGDGNVVNTGDNSTINVKTKINKGDLSSLKKALKEAKVSDEDIQELEGVIVSEQPDMENKTFGTKVNTWVQKMVGKALDGSWQVGIGAAGSILGESIMNFYGMK